MGPPASLYGQARLRNIAGGPGELTPN